MESIRKIIHCDCDCFYAAIEERDQPELKGRPVAVGGSADRRGVLTTCNYEARAFGVHSAMPTATALRLCPDLTLLPVRMQRYREASQVIRNIFNHYTEIIQPLSLDEAFLDVTASSLHHGSATLIARDLKKRVRQEVGITISAGVAPNKFLAKVASDWEKPDGLTVIRPEQVEEFVKTLPVEKIYGVGKVTAAKLHKMELRTCGDLQAISMMELIRRFGRFGEVLYHYSRGVDDREVNTDQDRKTYSTERTFNTDLETLPECESALEPLYEQLIAGVAKHLGEYAVKKVYVKLKFSDFSQTTAERGCIELHPDTARSLLQKAFARKSLPVRLIGLGVGFVRLDRSQLNMFAEQQSNEHNHE